MLKVTYGQLQNENFKRAMGKVANCPLFKNPKLAYNVAKISGRIAEEAKLADKLREKMVNEYAKKTDDGKIEPHNGIPGTFWIPEDKQKEWGEKLEEYHAVAFDIDRPALSLDELMPAALTPLEINALEPLITFDESAPEPAKLKPVP